MISRRGSINSIIAYKLFMLNNRLTSRIASEFQHTVQTIFKDNLEFAFIFGGVAKGYADATHDIDMFVCLNERDKYSEQHFRRWYFGIHRRVGLVPDYGDPGEIMSLAELVEKLDFLDELQITLTIRSYYAYEAIVWGDVLAGTTIGEVGDFDLLQKLKNRCAPFPERWKSQILAQLPQGHQLSNQPPLYLFEHFVTYLKEGRKNHLGS